MSIFDIRWGGEGVFNLFHENILSKSPTGLEMLVKISPGFGMKSWSPWRLECSNHDIHWMQESIVTFHLYMSAYYHDPHPHPLAAIKTPPCPNDTSTPLVESREQHIMERCITSQSQIGSRGCVCKALFMLSCLLAGVWASHCFLSKLLWGVAWPNERLNQQ